MRSSAMSASAGALARLALARPAVAATAAMRSSSSSSLMLARSSSVVAPSLARCFSAAAAAASDSAPTAATPASASSSPSSAAASDEYTHPRDLNPDWKSPTQRVLECLRSGPKTRWQLYYALNRGPPAEASEAQRQFRAVEAAKLASKISGGSASKRKTAEEELASLDSHPTGVLRNPTHLSRVLQGLTRGERVWTRPYSSVEGRLGEAERASIAAIVENHPSEHAKLVGRLGGKGWYYVAADWAKPGFTAKREHKQAQYAAKMDRRAERTQARLEQAAQSGKVFPYSKPFGLTAKERRKAAEAQKEAEKEKALKQAVRAYHEELGIKKPRKGEEASQ